jgi:RNA polymerase sigma-70 factor (ECF subfamily)
MDELEAVSKLKGGDKQALNFFFNKYYNRLVAYIVTYNHDNVLAEDVVQQAFIKLWVNRERLDTTKSPKNYLYTIAFNLFVDSVKKRKKEQQFLIDTWNTSLNPILEEDDMALENRIKKMQKIIATLPPKCKEIIHLNKIEGVKYKDIAIKLGISIKTVESQMRIAFQKIRNEF